MARYRLWLNACIADCTAALNQLRRAEEAAAKAAADACAPNEWALTDSEAALRAKLLLRRGCVAGL